MKNQTKQFVFGITLFISSTIFAQVGIGTNTPNASAALEVASTTKGLLAPRMTSAQRVAISSPADGLVVYQTDNTPNFYGYINGAWAPIAAPSNTFVNGSLGTSSNSNSGSFLSFSTITPKSFGASITLPPGKWEVILNLANNIETTGQRVYTNEKFYFSYWLQDVTTNSADADYNSPYSPSNITSDALFSGSAMITCPVFLDGGIGDEVIKGSFFINNSTASSKTYYLKFMEYISKGMDASIDNSLVIFYKNLGGSTWKSNRFYAVKIQ